MYCSYLITKKEVANGGLKVPPKATPLKRINPSDKAVWIRFPHGRCLHLHHGAAEEPLPC